jgi:hypothetical protein
MALPYPKRMARSIRMVTVPEMPVTRRTTSARRSP